MCMLSHIFLVNHIDQNKGEKCDKEVMKTYLVKK